jgi:hypothetical protein
MMCERAIVVQKSAVMNISNWKHLMQDKEKRERELGGGEKRGERISTTEPGDVLQKVEVQ